MSEVTRYTKWQKAVGDAQGAQGWHDLPKGPRYQCDTFEISPAHCKLSLTRCGQQSHGSKNYWESPDALNRALIQVIIRHRNTLIPEAIELLKKEADEALVACKGWLDGMRSQIDELEAACESSEVAESATA